MPTPKHIMISRECFDAHNGLMKELIVQKIVEVVFYKNQVIVGRYGTNKSTLKDIAVKELK